MINAEVLSVPFLLSIHLLNIFGNPIDRLLILGEICVKLIHNVIIIIPTIIVSTDIEVAESLMNDQNVQSNPHRMVNQIILPLLK